MSVTISIPTGPQSVRVFCGYRLATLDRQRFFAELGQTFMPGTPYMLAPLGLAGYVAATLDFEPQDALPDEVALIVYASPEAYSAAREQSLQGRMYTHSHAGVFDMQRSRGQFPGTLAQPDKQSATGRWAWYLFERGVDWQQGSTRLWFLRARDGAALQEPLHRAMHAGAKTFEAHGADQVITVTADNYAAIWMHSVEPVTANLSTFLATPPGASLARDLTATAVRMRNGVEGPTITGTAAYSFRFVRDLRFFL